MHGRVGLGMLVCLVTAATNASDTPVSVEVCGTRPNPVLERAGADGWAPYAGGVCALNKYDGVLPVAPGATVRDSLDLGPGRPGVFRLVFEYDTNWTATVASASFMVP